MTWFEALPAILIACGVVLVPGLIVTSPFRFGLLTSVALAGPVGVCVTGVAAILSGAFDGGIGALQVMFVTVLTFLLSLLLARRAPRTRRVLGARTGLMAAAWVLSAAAFAWITFAQVPSPERISQTYDNVFHLSATSAIVDGFSASPLTLRSLIETEAGGIAYYPSAWHSLAALTTQLAGVSVPVAFNAVWIAMGACIWLPGVAWLSRLLVRSQAAAIVGLLLGASFGWYPYALLTWGTIYPTAFAHSLLPAVVGVTILAVRSVVARDVFSRRWDAAVRRRWALAFGSVIVMLAALGIAHPRVLPTWLLLVAPYLLWRIGVAAQAARRLGNGAARRSRTFLLTTTGVVVLTGVAAFGYAVLKLGLFDEPLSDRLSGPQARARQSIWQGVVQILTLQSRTGTHGIVTQVAPLLALAVLAGLVIALLRRRDLRWMTVSYLLVALLYVLAAGSDDDITKLLTGLWYKDGYRLVAALPVLAVPLAVLAVTTLIGALAPRRRVRGLVLAAGAAVVVAATAGSALALTGVSEATGRVFHQPAQAADREIVSTKQIEFMAEVVPEFVSADQRVLGDPWDGSALTGLYADRAPVFPHVNGQWDKARRVLAWNLELIETDPAVCAALDDLRVRYVLYNPHEFGGGDPSGNHFPGPHDAVDAGLFEQVATDGESILFRIDQCGALEPR